MGDLQSNLGPDECMHHFPLENVFLVETFHQVFLPPSGTGPPSYQFQACDNPLTAVCVSTLPSYACTRWVSLKLLSDHVSLGEKNFQELFLV